jgi:hypothetical protein
MHPTHPGRRPWPTVLLLVVTALLLALFAVVLVAPPVGAHPLGGVESSNYQARVLAVRPPVPGLTVEVVDAGSRLRLVNTGPRDVVVLGYQLEPWLRVGPRGVFENSRSPTLQMAGPRRADSPPPAAVDPGAPASWRQVDAGQSVAWHDHRAHWEADEPPTQVRRAPGSTHVVIPQWTVKLRSGRRLVDVVGEVRWLPGPSPLPWLAGAALLAMAVVAVGRTRRWSDALAAALALVVALDLVQAAGAWTAAQAPLAGKLLSIGASAAGWVLAGLAIRQLLRRRVESGLFQLLLAAGLLTVVGGLGDLGYLLRSQLATTLPTWVVRAAVTAKIGLGLGALTAAALRLQRTLTPQAEDRHDQGWTWVEAERGGGSREPTVRGWAADVDSPAPATRGWAGGGDSPARSIRGLAMLPRRGPQDPEGRVKAARATVEAPAGATVEAGGTLATVLPWPGGRRADSFDDLDDPDLPGGA